MKNCFDRISRRKAYRMTGISADSVRQRVAQKLGDAPEEQERTRRRMKKRLFLSALVAALMFATAAAAGGGYLSHFFPNGISTFEKAVSTKPIECIFGGEWKITATQTLTDENSTYVELKVTAVTEETKAYLADFDNWEFHFFPMFDFLMDGEYIPFEYWSNAAEYHCGSYKEPEAAEDYIYAWMQFSCPNPERKPITIELSSHDTHEPYTELMDIPTQKTIGESVTLTPGQKVKNYDNVKETYNALTHETVSNVRTVKDVEQEITINKLSLTPFGIQLEYAGACDDQSTPDLRGCIFFEMADGAIYSSNHVLNWFKAGTNEDDLEHIHARANFRQVQPLTAYKSVVIGTTAYPLDGGKPYQVKVDSHLKPFTITTLQKKVTETNIIGESYETTADWYSVKDLCDKLGAGYSWDAEKKCAVITYCGDTLTLPLGKTDFNTPGDIIPDTVEAELSNGTLIANYDLLSALRLRARGTADESVKIIYP